MKKIIVLLFVFPVFVFAQQVKTLDIENNLQPSPSSPTINIIPDTSENNVPTIIPSTSVSSEQSIPA